MAWLLVNPVIDKSIRNSNGGRNSGGERPSMEGNDNARKQHENNSYSTPIQLQNNRDKDKDKDKDKEIQRRIELRSYPLPSMKLGNMPITQDMPSTQKPL